MTNLSEVVAEFNRAKGMWKTASWTHEMSSDPIVYCEGDNPLCDTCAQAEEDAAMALGYAESALDSLQQGDYQQATYLARRAYDTEMEWGDAPAWRRFCTLVESIAEEVEEG